MAWYCSPTWKILGWYFFKYSFCSILSLFSFQDFNDVYWIFPPYPICFLYFSLYFPLAFSLCFSLCIIYWSSKSLTFFSAVSSLLLKPYWVISAKIFSALELSYYFFKEIIVLWYKFSNFYFFRYTNHNYFKKSMSKCSRSLFWILVICSCFLAWLEFSLNAKYCVWNNMNIIWWSSEV